MGVVDLLWLFFNAFVSVIMILLLYTQKKINMNGAQIFARQVGKNRFKILKTNGTPYCQTFFKGLRKL